MAQPLMGLPRQPFKQSNAFPGAGETDPANQLFDQFCSANTFHCIMDTFQQLCDVVDLRPSDHQIFYKQLKTRLNSWKAQSLWTKLDKRASSVEYKKGTSCNKTRALVVGAGPCGLRVAIEIALLGGKTVVIEKREGFSRNNVLHLWPFLIHDLKALGAKKFFGKFCAGAIDHISIRALQCILLKVALLLGVEIHSGVTFEEFSEPPPDQTQEPIGWRAKVSPADHPLSEFVFDVCISADGKRNTMTEIKRKELRGKLAIAITANFINRNTKEESCVEEISGVAYIFNQKFFKDLNQHAGIDLENIVYYKDETHYFVMTAKKQSLLRKGVLMQDYDDPETLLSKENVDQRELLDYARQAADMSTRNCLPNLEFAHNHYGQPDVAMFDFTSMFTAEHACRVVERQGYRLLIGLVGDTLLEPFWPTGSGCARGFLGVFDAAWMIRSWSSGKMTPLEVIAERESVYQLLSQTTPENLNKNYLQYTVDPNTRYLNLNMQCYKPHQVASQYDGHDKDYLNEIVRQAVQESHRYDSVRESHKLLKWIQRQLESYQTIVKVVDLTTSFRSGIALCALIHRHRPALIDVYSLDPNRVEANNQMAFDVIEKEFGISPVMTGQEMAVSDVPNKMTMISYLSRISEIIRKESASRAKLSERKEQESKSRLYAMAKIGSHIRQRQEEMEKNDHSGQKRFQNPLSFSDLLSKRPKDAVLNAYGRLDDVDYDEISKYTNIKKELRLLNAGVRGQSSRVGVLAKDIASKFSGEVTRSINDSKQSASLFGKPRPADVCYFCKSRVYTVERYTAEGLLFHRGCFRCDYCGSLLRICYYSFKRNEHGDGKFYCVQHRGLQQQQQPVNTSGPAIPNTGLSRVKHAVTSPKMSLATESCLRVPGKSSSSKTPERVEYVTESEVEESEYEQTKHNLCSVLRTSAFSDSDSSSSEEELHFSDEDASDEEPDFSWANLARNYNKQLRQTREEAKANHQKARRTSSASSGSDTETVEGASDADYETDSDNTDKENLTEGSEDFQQNGRLRSSQGREKRKTSREDFSKHLLSLSPKQNIQQETKPSPTSVEIMRNKMAFFNTVSQPVRIDALSFLGLAAPPLPPSAKTEEEPAERAPENQAEEEVTNIGETRSERTSEERDERYERLSKRRVDKKRTTQKTKKRTKRRKKEDKNRITADVEKTRISTMHEAVPVVSISGATTSDEDDEKEDEAVIQLRNEEDSGDERQAAEAEEMESEKKMMVDGEVEGRGGGGMLLDLGSHHSAEDGSPISETSQTLQFTESDDEDVSPRRGMIDAEAMLDSKRTRSSEDDSEEHGGSSKGGALAVDDEHQVLDGKINELEMMEADEDAGSARKERNDGKKRSKTCSEESDEKCVYSQALETTNSNSSEEVEGKLEKDGSAREEEGQRSEEADECSEDQKLEHEYVVLENVAVETEAGKFSPYEELLADESDKEYTKLGTELHDHLNKSSGEIQTHITVQECLAGDDDDSVQSVSGAEININDIVSADVGKLSAPKSAPRAQIESYSGDEDGALAAGGGVGAIKDANDVVTDHVFAPNVERSRGSGEIKSEIGNDDFSSLSNVTIPRKMQIPTKNSTMRSDVVTDPSRSAEHRDVKIPLDGNIPATKKEYADDLSQMERPFEDFEKKEKYKEEVHERSLSLTQPDSFKFEYIDSSVIAEMSGENDETLEIIEDSDVFHLTSSEIPEEIDVQVSSCKILNQLPLVGSGAKQLAAIDGSKEEETLASNRGGNRKEEEEERVSLDPLSRINLLLESLSFNRSHLSDSVLSEDGSGTQPELGDDPVKKSDISTTGSNLVCLEKEKEKERRRERPNSLEIVEGTDNDVYKSSCDGKAPEKPRRTKESSSDSLRSFNASTTSGSADFTSLMLNRDAEQLTSGTDGGSVSNLLNDDNEDGSSSVDRPATTSLNSDNASLENVVEVNVEGEEEDLSNIEVEVWPRVVLDRESSENADSSKRADVDHEVLSLNSISSCPSFTSSTAERLRKENYDDKKPPPLTMTGVGEKTETQSLDNKSVSLASTSSVLSPNRIGDAKRKFFFETAQPLRIDPSAIIKDIPSSSSKQPVFSTKKVSVEESSSVSCEFETISEKKLEETAVETNVVKSDLTSTSIVGSCDATERCVVNTTDAKSQTTEKRRLLPSIPTTDRESLSSKSSVNEKDEIAIEKSGSSSSCSEKGRRVQMLASEFPLRSMTTKKEILTEKKRPNSAYVVTEDVNWRLKIRGSPQTQARPISAKPSANIPQKQASTGSCPLPTAVAESSPQSSHVSQSDGASTEEASPLPLHKDKENRLKGFYQKTKTKEPPSPAVAKEKKKSILGFFVPSRSLDKKKNPKSSPLLTKTKPTDEPSSKKHEEVNMAAVREKTKSLPLEKKRMQQTTTTTDETTKKTLSSKGKQTKSKAGKANDEGDHQGQHSIYEEMAPIMEGIKRVEKRNKDKHSIRDRIQAVAPPPAKAPNTVLLPPKADVDDFETESEVGDDRLSLCSFQSQMHLLSDEEASKLKKRQQKLSRRKQREKELKRLHAAQEIQRQLEEIEMRQKEIEENGISVEKALQEEGGGGATGSNRDEAVLLQEWFDLVHEKNVLMLYESELMVEARELELEDRQSRLEIQLRERIPHAECQRTESLKEEEEMILQELMEVVEQRDALVALLEEDRVRQHQYSKNLERIMAERGFQMSPISHLQQLPQALASLRENR